MNKIATWAEINTRVKSNGSPNEKCPTKSEILATNKAKINNDAAYASNQCVKLSDISEAKLYNYLSVTEVNNSLHRIDTTYPVASRLTVYVTFNWINDDRLPEYVDYLAHIEVGTSSQTIYTKPDCVFSGIKSISPTNDDTYYYRY